MKKLVGAIGVMALLAITMVGVVVTPVQAKTYYTFAGHSAVRYEQSDIPRDLQPYIEKVEYDAACGHGYGVRLYLKSIRPGYNSSLLSFVTDFVTSRPEWYSDRSYQSIATEIAIHCRWFKIHPIHIEYSYQDLKRWEKVAYGR